MGSSPEHTSKLRANRRKVAKAVKAIHAYYSAGLKSLDNYPGRMVYGKMEDEAGRFRMNQEKLRRARVFANPRAGGYTERQLDRLCEQCERHDFPLGISMINLLLSVPKKDRRALERKIVKGKWSKARLRRQITARYGKRGQAGRPVQPPEDAVNAQVQIAQFCGQWRRFFESLARAPLSQESRKSQAKPVWSDLSPTVRRWAKDADDVLKRLEARVVERLDADREE